MTMQIEPIIGPFIAGGLGLSGVALTIWAQDRRERRSGRQDVVSSKRQLDLMAAWLEVNEKLTQRGAGAEIPPALTEDLRRAYVQAHRGADTLAARNLKFSWARVGAAILPPTDPQGVWAKLWAGLYRLYAVVLGLLFLAVFLGVNVFDSFTDALVSFVIASLAIGGVPLAFFREMSIRADVSARDTGRTRDTGRIRAPRSGPMRPAPYGPQPGEPVAGRS
jgi:hypothetical protein